MRAEDIHFELELDGVVMTANVVQGHVPLDAPFVFEIEAVEVTDDATAPETRLGKPAIVRLQPEVGDPLVVHGIVTSLQTERGKRGETIFEHHVEVRPAVAALQIGRDHRYFQELDAIEIVKKVLELAAVDASTVTWETSGSYRKRPYTVQYGESDWAFIARLCREEGIGVRFDFEEAQTKLVFFDDTSSAPKIPGDSIAFRRGGAQGGEDAVLDVRRRTSVVHDQVVLRAYEPTKPTLDQTVTAAAGSTKHPVYDYPGRYIVPPEGRPLADHRLQALRARRLVVEGVCTGMRLRVGHVFTIDDAPYPAYEGPFLLTELRIDCARRQEQEHFEAHAQVHWQAIPADVPWRPTLEQDGVTHASSIGGAQTSMMVGPSGKELHVDDNGRIRTQFWWDRVGKKDEKAGTWTRVGQFALGGSMVLPRIGWDLLVEHHAGDGDAPFVIGHLYDGAHPPPYALPANKTRTSWQTATTPGDGTSNEVRFEDKKGSEEMFINASKDMSVTIGDAKTKKVGADHSHEIGSNHDVKVGANRTLGVKADQSIDVGASESITVSTNRATSVAGSDTVTIGASRTVTVIKGKTLDADGGRTMTVGANMFDISALGVSRAVLGSASVTVGGAWISAAATGLANATAGAAAETVGGVKLQVGVGGVALTVKGALAETVGAAYVNAAGGDFGETATGALSITVGGALIANAPNIEIEAESEIAIVCGGTSVTIKSGSIEIKSPAIPAPAGTIAMDAGQIHHNP